MKSFQKQCFLCFGASILLGLTGCSPTKYLTADQFLLEKNVLHLSSTYPIENKRTLSYELSTLYRQKPNGSLFLFFPREWFYFKTAARQDTSRFNSWINRFIAEVPAIYSYDLANQAAAGMETFLQYKGYYDAKVFVEEQLAGKKKKKLTAHYYADTGHRYTVDSLFLRSPDPAIQRILDDHLRETFFKRGENPDGKIYELEKDRISRLLRNHGYAFFYPNYISQMEVDTTRYSHYADIFLNVVPPSNDPNFRTFFVGDIVVYPAYFPGINDYPLRDTLIDGIVYRDTAFNFFVKPTTIKDAIHLQKGIQYKDELYDVTNKQLGGLQAFQFVRIRQEADSLFPNKLNFRIELTPTPKFETGVDFDINYTNRSNAAGIGNLIGISLSPSIRHRNLFKGAETLLSKLSAGVEVNPSPDGTQFWNTVDLRLQSDLYWPKFRDYLGIWKKLGPLLSTREQRSQGGGFYPFLESSGTSHLSGSLNYVSLLNFYNYTLFNAGYGFDARTASRRYSINHLGIDYLRPVFQPASDTIINQNAFFRNSFSRQLFVSLLFKDLNFVSATRPNNIGISKYLGLNLETAGFETWAGNALYNLIGGNQDTLKIRGVSLSQFVRLDTDFRVYRQIDSKRSLALRINAGIARPFGFSREVHYVKQFFAGGPNSIRGWPARALGPGGHIDSLSITGRNPLFFYQAGDLKFEFNLEYRFNIFWRLDGAWFLDGGNIWTVRRDPTRPGSQFRFNTFTDADLPPGKGVYDPFYKQIALSPGFGARLDFTYFIFRLDLGLKMRYPYRWDGVNFWNPPRNWLKNPNINLGLGLPF